MGDRIEVYWDGEDAWFAGRVTAVGNDGATVDVAYDDGDVEQNVATDDGVRTLPRSGGR